MAHIFFYLPRRYLYYLQIARRTPLRFAQAEGSHAQRTPLNMGALRRVTADYIYHYRARTCEAIEEVRHRHRSEPCTRGFQPAVSRSETRTLWIRFTTAGRGGKQAERARGDA